MRMGNNATTEVIKA